MGYYAARAVIAYRSFGTTDWSHLQGKDGSADFSLENGTDSCPEASVRNYQYSLRNNPVELLICKLLSVRHEDVVI